MILFLHNRYRTTGGEERVVADLVALVRDELHEDAELFARDSSHTSRTKAAGALLGGGTGAGEVAEIVKSTGARIVHAHNLHPLFGWRALAAARSAGAKVVLHLHQYRLVCAVGVCFTNGQECTRCHGRNTLPGVLRNCRGNRAEAFSYAAALALWQRRVLEQADVVIVPSAFAERRLRDLGAPLPEQRTFVLPPPVLAADGDALSPPALAASDRSALEHERDAPEHERHALVVSRLSPEKGVEVAIDACMKLRKRLVIAGDGPLLEQLQERVAATAGVDVRAAGLVSFAGRVSAMELERLRRGAALAIVPSRSAETFGVAAAEAMAAGLPVVASDVGALPELVERDALVPSGDAEALAGAIARFWGDAEAGQRARARVAAICAPEAVAGALRNVYERASRS